MFSRALPLLVLFGSAALAVAEEPPVRDPMRPFAASESSAVAARAPFELTAVLISPARRVAIINGKAYQPGAVVDGAEIVAIETGAVRLRKDGSERRISLGRPPEAKPSVTQGDRGP